MVKGLYVTLRSWRGEGRECSFGELEWLRAWVFLWGAGAVKGVSVPLRSWSGEGHECSFEVLGR